MLQVGLQLRGTKQDFTSESYIINSRVVMMVMAGYFLPKQDLEGWKKRKKEKKTVGQPPQEVRSSLSRLISII